MIGIGTPSSHSNIPRPIALSFLRLDVLDRTSKRVHLFRAPDNYCNRSCRTRQTRRASPDRGSAPADRRNPRQQPAAGRTAPMRPREPQGLPWPIESATLAAWRISSDARSRARLQCARRLPMVRFDRSGNAPDPPSRDPASGVQSQWITSTTARLSGSTSTTSSLSSMK